jgi:hypothetical protein
MHSHRDHLFFIFSFANTFRTKVTAAATSKCVYILDLYIHEWVCKTEIDLCDNRPCSTYICTHTYIKKKKKEKLTGERLEHDNKRRYNES